MSSFAFSTGESEFSHASLFHRYRDCDVPFLERLGGRPIAGVLWFEVWIRDGDVGGLAIVEDGDDYSWVAVYRTTRQRTMVRSSTLSE